jgi:quinol-cytochrome oxidoreductase complex cytochrome b subunit
MKLSWIFTGLFLTIVAAIMVMSALGFDLEDYLGPVAKWIFLGLAMLVVLTAFVFHIILPVIYRILNRRK